MKMNTSISSCFERIDVELAMLNQTKSIVEGNVVEPDPQGSAQILGRQNLGYGTGGKNDVQKKKKVKKFHVLKCWMFSL
jgi:hypothetical protein